MKRSKQLLKNTFILFLGNFLPKLTVLITLPILTGKLTKDNYGIYDFIITLVSLLLPAATLQIQSAAFRFLIDCRNDKEKQNIIISNILTFVTLISILILLILIFVINKINIYLRIIIAVYYFLDIILIVQQQIIRGIGKNLSYTISAIINSFTSMLFTVAFVLYLNYGILGAITSLLLSCLISNLYLAYDIKLHKRFKIKYLSINEIKDMLSYSWPMVPNNLSGWILNLSDRIIITAFIGIKANAIYAVANKIPNLLGIAKNTFIFAWQENASVALKDDNKDEYYTFIFERVIRINLGLMGILIALTPIMFKLLIHGNYEESYIHIPILFFGMLFSCISSFIGGIYVAYKKTKSVGITTVIAALCNLIIDLLLVKKIGIFAGSISTLISYLLLLIYRFIDVQKFQRIKVDYKMIIYSIILLIIMSIICTKRSIYFIIINIIIGICYMYILNKRIIEEYIQIFRERLKL